MLEIIVSMNNGVIDLNFDELKKYLDEQLAIYRGMQFTEETKADAKKTVAELRKLRSSIDDKRKEVKKEYMQPYDAFELKMKELTGLVDEPINYINEQVAEFEKKRIEEKKAEIEAIYEAAIPAEVKDILTLERLYNPKWENVSTSRKDIEDSIKTEALNLTNNINIVKSMNEECEEDALHALYATLNLADAINYINDYKAKKEAIIARQKAEEERKEAERLEAEKKATEEAAREPEADPEPQADEICMLKAVYEIEADAMDISLFEGALNDLGIKYRRVE